MDASTVQVIPFKGRPFDSRIKSQSWCWVFLFSVFYAQPIHPLFSANSEHPQTISFHSPCILFPSLQLQQIVQTRGFKCFDKKFTKIFNYFFFFAPIENKERPPEKKGVGPISFIIRYSPFWRKFVAWSTNVKEYFLHYSKEDLLIQELNQQSWCI